MARACFELSCFSFHSPNQHLSENVLSSGTVTPGLPAPTTLPSAGKVKNETIPAALPLIQHSTPVFRNPGYT